ncbi:DUF1648 domain-containing protein [Macrococcus lamae]|uniref:DUF1648 domain-containing protein n=1 Tax=Macrococcus lamae TaxID=198484 RepID=A0A4V3BF01_9STAP|nr:DUF1648 domain-containing protein [Macrococcus lamae]TDM12110.1 DUF1648 domain-containing protein [Macrococcus lamae]
MIEAMTMTLIILVTGLIFLFAGRFTKRNILFSVYVPDHYQNNQEIGDVRRRFRNRVVTATVVSAVIQFVAVLIANQYVVIVFVLLINLLILAEVLFYKQANEQLKQLKEQGQWMEGLKVLRATDTSARDDLSLLPWQLYAIPFALLTLSVFYVALNYAAIPDRIAVHWNINNEPDRWENKSFLTVFYPALVGYGIMFLMAATNSGINHFPMMLNPAAKEASQNYENSTRKNNSYLMFILTVVMALMFGFILVQPLIFPPGYMPPYVMPLIIGGMIIPIIVSIIYQLRADKKYREAAALTDRAPYHNDSNYKWGMFYYNKEDPNVWVPKVSQWGMTMNFARPEAVMISILFLILTLLPVIILLVLSI